jgi:hypothetical protein
MGRERFEGAALIALMALLSAACVSMHATPPEGLGSEDTPSAAGDADDRDDCPDLSGRFQDSGELSPTTPAGTCDTSSPNYVWALDWLCETSLARNLKVGAEPRSWVELRQPEKDTLVVVSGPGTDARFELHRKHGEFSCGANKLTRHQVDIWRPAATYGNAAGGDPSGGENPFGRVLTLPSAFFGAAFLGTGGVASLKRSFQIDAAGSLVMEITRSKRGVTLLIPTSYVYSTFVTWRRVQSAENVPFGDASVIPGGDLPETQNGNVTENHPDDRQPDREAPR